MVTKSVAAGLCPATVAQALQWAVNYLQEKRIAQPHLDAEVLLAHTLRLDKPGLYLHLNQSIAPAKLKAFQQYIYRRSQHEPVAYIIGKKEFWSLDFTVGPEVLIPRPETEFLVEETLKIARGLANKTIRILDIGTGSGNIAISLAKELDNCWILALDVSFEALLLAKKNIQKHKVTERVHIIAGDLFLPLKQDLGPFHLIVSNPPYIAEEDWDDLAPEVKEYEPKAALDGGPKGEGFLRHIIHEAPDYLLPDGFLLLELGYNHSAAVRFWVKEEPGLALDSIIPDYSGTPRIVVIKKHPSYLTKSS